MKMVWLSANILGLKLLEFLQREISKIVSTITITIVTLNDKSGVRMYDGIKSHKWNKFDLPLFCIEDSSELEKTILSLSPDLIFMCGWRQIIPENVLSLPPKGIIGFHPTLLPKGRGPAPIINSIMEGVRETGLSMFYVSSSVDAGDIIGQKKFIIGEDDDARAVYCKIIKAGRALMKEFFPKIIEGTAPRIPQNEKEATYFPKRSLKDNEISSGDSAEIAYRKILALSWPYRGAFIRIGGRKLIIHKAELR